MRASFLSEKAEAYFATIDFNIKLTFIIFTVISTFALIHLSKRWYPINERHQKTFFVPKTDKELEEIEAALKANGIEYKLTKWGWLTFHDCWLIVDSGHRQITMQIINEVKAKT